MAPSIGIPIAPPMAAPIAEPNASAIPCGDACGAMCGIDVGVALPYMRLNIAMTSTSGGGAFGRVGLRPRRLARARARGPLRRRD